MSVEKFAVTLFEVYRLFCYKHWHVQGRASQLIIGIPIQEFLVLCAYTYWAVTQHNGSYPFWNPSESSAHSLVPNGNRKKATHGRKTLQSMGIELVTFRSSARWGLAAPGVRTRRNKIVALILTARYRINTILPKLELLLVRHSQIFSIFVARMFQGTILSHFVVASNSICHIIIAKSHF